jgi:hypothetical protein
MSEKTQQFLSDVVGVLGGYFLYRMLGSATFGLFASTLWFTLGSIVFEKGKWVRVLQAVLFGLGIMMAVYKLLTPTDPYIAWFNTFIWISAISQMLINFAQRFGKVANWIGDRVEDLRKAG